MTLSSVSVIVPAYNEEATIGEAVRRIRTRQPLDVELIVVDDGSTDHTFAELCRVIDLVDVVMRLPENGGRGSAVRQGMRRATGDIVVLQDADLELDPAMIPDLVAPIRGGRADFVTGCRMHEGNRSAMSWPQWWANRIITGAACRLLPIKMRDIETAAKAFPRHLVEAMELECCRFDLEPEIVAKLARLGARIQEIPIGFQPRTKAEGKKIRAIDTVGAFVALMRYWSWRPAVAPDLPEPAPSEAVLPESILTQSSAPQVPVGLA